MDKKTNTLGSRIRALREKQSLTQKELADKIEISKSALGMYETDKREPNLIIIKKLCKVLGTTGDFLIGFDKISENEENQTPAQKKSEIQEKYDSLNEDGKQRLLDYADDLLGNEKYTKALYKDKESKLA